MGVWVVEGPAAYIAHAAFVTTPLVRLEMLQDWSFVEKPVPVTWTSIPVCPLVGISVILGTPLEMTVNSA